MSLLHQRKPLPTALALWTEGSDGPLRYQNWLRSRRMDVLVRRGEASAATVTPNGGKAPNATGCMPKVTPNTCRWACAACA